MWPRQRARAVPGALSGAWGGRTVRRAAHGAMGRAYANALGGRTGLMMRGSIDRPEDCGFAILFSFQLQRPDD
jgi:hypothetical protein|uniref:Uncharacterized protein n=1 Tax=Oryza sativa subsp. japonica TaxID=39947 RepID=Q6H5L9_ORYSJ|nr:hypothetical protein [Oryza sativa Japonica Group]BAD25980.1 hypothetical protein [Oryza sativa Japonica Group]